MTVELGRVVVCASCGVWPVDRARDQHCSWCGTPLRRLEILHAATGERAAGGRLRHHLTEVKGSETFELHLVLSGGIEVELAKAESDSRALSFRLQGRTALADGRPATRLRVEADARAVAGAPRAPVEVRLLAADGRVERFLLEVLPPVALELLPSDPDTEREEKGEVHVVFTRPSLPVEEKRLRFRVRGTPLLPTGAELAAGSSDWFELREAVAGRAVPEGGELSFALARKGTWAHGDERRARVLVRASGLARPVEIAIGARLARREGGSLVPARVHFPAVTIGFETARPVALENSDDYPLGVRSIRPSAPWIEVGEDRGAPGGALRPATGPYALSPGERRSYVVRLATEHALFPAPDSGPLAACVVFELDLADPSRRELEVSADAVRAPRALAGFLAIDFGTTNTCVAVGGEGGETRVLEMGGDSSVPTVLYFEDVSTPEAPRYQIGNRAKALVRLGAKEALVKNFKRRIGLERPERVFDRKGNSAWYTADQLAGFFLKELVRQAQEALRSQDREGSRVEEVVFTYPVLFSDRQVELLAEVYRRDLSLPRVHRSLDEANAGAVRHVYGEALRELGAAGRDAPRRVEYVLNYDFGGGTIDIALLAVVKDYPAQRVESTPIGVTGLYRFGGEDITVLVRDLIMEKVRAKVPRVRIPVGDPDSNPGEYEAVRGNNYLLYLLAETAKKAVYGSVATYEIETDSGFWSDLAVDFGSGLERIGPTSGLFRGLSEDAGRILVRRPEVDERIRPYLKESVERAYNLWRFTVAHERFGIDRKAKIDEVVLTGKSSSIPMVADLFAERFGLERSRVVFRPEEAKKVVAEGACFYRQFESAAIEGLEFAVGDVADRVTVPLGVQKTVNGRPCFSPLFLNGTPLALDAEGSRAAGEKVYVAESVHELRLDRPEVFVRILRNLDYTDEIDLRTGGTEKVGYFEIEKGDPFFAPWPAERLRAVPCRFRLEKRPASGRYSLQAIFEREDGERKTILFHFEDRYLAAVPEGLEASGSGTLGAVARPEARP
ncbi:MAG: Hsp70 family protein [Planctomycetes bacterium]|nr:Hsp70 family protein [Planctomycetota bacterium]